MHGLEDALDAVLGMLGGARPIPSNVVKNLCSNRAAKARVRRRIAAELWPAIGQPPSQAARTDSWLVLEAAKRLLGPTEFDFIVEAVEGTYSSVAQVHGIAIGTVKARVSRARERVRALT